MGLTIRYRQDIDAEGVIDLYSIYSGFYKSGWCIDDLYPDEIRHSSILNSLGYNLFVNPDLNGYYYKSQTLDASYITNFSYISDVYGHMYTYGYKIDETNNLIRIGYDLAGKPLQLVAGDERVVLRFTPINSPTIINKNGLIDYTLFPHTDIIQVLPDIHGPSFIVVNKFYLNIFNAVYNNDITSGTTIFGDSDYQYVRAERIRGRFYNVPKWVILDTTTTNSVKVTEKYPSLATASYTPIDAIQYIDSGILYMNLGSIRPDVIWVKVDSIDGVILKVNVNPFVLFHGGQRSLLDTINIGIEKATKKLVYTFLGERDTYGNDVVYNVDGHRLVGGDILWFSSWRFKRISSDYKKINSVINRE